MSQDKMDSAKNLIQQKRYDEARQILAEVDHPLATKWLQKLDELQSAPVEVESQQPAKTTNWLLWATVANFAIILFLGIAVASLFIRLSRLSEVVDLNTGEITDMIDVVNSHASDINSLASDLRSVSSIASNANRYAHSHTYSDSRLKSNVAEIENSLDRVLQLRAVTFTWNDAIYPDLGLETGEDYGLLAQELAVVFPELVALDEQSGFLRVDYEGLVPILIQAIQEQQIQIDELRSGLNHVRYK
jgi:hypothetical protein